MVATCIVCLAPYVLAPLDTVPVGGALLLFYGFLTVVNAPPDWPALGFIRALIRRGVSARAAGLNSWILSRMPAGKTVRERDRLTVAAALTWQFVGGMALTGIATYLVAIYLIPLGLPAFGAVVRDFAADLAAYNAPARMMIWLTGGM